MTTTARRPIPKRPRSPDSRKRALSRSSAKKRLPSSKKVTDSSTPCAKTTKKKKAPSLQLFVVQVGGMPRALPQRVGDNMYAIPRNVGDPVTFAVVTGPDNDAAEWAQVAWTVNDVETEANGNSVTVRTNADGRFDVSAAYAGDRQTITLWVFWCALQVHAAGALPGDCRVHFGSLGAHAITANPRALGPRTGVVQGVIQGCGRVCIQADMTPGGIHQFVDSSLRICREVVREKTWFDGGGLVDHANRGDTNARADQKQWVPNAQDHLFDLDAPNIARWQAVNASIETYMSFRQWVTYDGTVCSDDVEWHFIGEFLNGTAHPALQANPHPAQVVTIVSGVNPTVPRVEVAAGALDVASIVAPRYTSVAGPHDVAVTNHGERP